MAKFYAIVIVLIFIHVCVNQEIGAPCDFSNTIKGVCTTFRDCKTRKSLINLGYAPKKCENRKLTLCCVKDDDLPPPKLNITPTCPKPDSKLIKIEKDGRGKARDYCIDIVNMTSPCVKGIVLPGIPTPLVRLKRCNHFGTPLIINGTEAQPKEFPHQVLLGYQPELNTDKAIWLCGGTLISDEWVLTAGHCIWHKSGGRVSLAKIGVLYADNDRMENIYNVSKIVKHPDYIGSSKFNDIALLKLDRKVQFNEEIIPACLDHEGIVPNKALATGWGLTESGEETSKSNILMKVSINLTDECSNIYKKNYDKESNGQLCYGGSGVDTCQGDSGGPIQVKNTQVYCTYTVFGITSFGRGCGGEKAAGVYTRVYNYLKWIEDVVWP